MADKDDLEDSQYPDNDEYVPYVTAGNLAQRNGAKVSLWGKVTKVSASEGFYVKTVDDQEILIRLKKPLSEPLEGWYEIHGVSQGKVIVCDEYVPFSGDMAKNVDVEGYKSLAKLLAALDDPWNLGEDSSGMQGVTAMDEKF
uniref:Replication Protein A3 n=1 Tax=Pararge aegeria TaxID=116150 RepID=S4NR10_9NEOP